MDVVPSSQTSEGRRWFVTTHWSVVLAAKSEKSAQADVALQKLCSTYWPPLYAYIRREGYDASEAEDLTQEFFARILQKDYLSRLQQERGRFRSFLLAYLKHFLLEQHRKAHTQKRGGQQVIVSLEERLADTGFLREPVDALTPDQAYERRWAQTVMQRAVDRLREEYVRSGRSQIFVALQDFQPHEPDGESYAQIGIRLGLSEAAVKSAMQRLRQRHREILREEVAHTVNTPGEIDEELRYLRALLSTTAAA
jgi:RNA polymerase sigma-70 factor (ECF subfamily)